MGACQSQEHFATTAGAVKVTAASDVATAAKPSSSVTRNNKQDPYTNSKHRRKIKRGMHITPRTSNNGHTKTPATVQMTETDHSSIEPVIEEDEYSGYDYEDDINDAAKASDSPKSKSKLKKKKSMWTPRTAKLDTADENGLISPPCPTLLFNNSNAGITSPLSPFEGNNLSALSESKSLQPLHEQQPSEQQPRKQLKRSSSKKKKKKTQRRNSGHQRGFNGTPAFATPTFAINSDGSNSISSSNNKLMTPLQLAPLGASMIPEEEDPTAPSDEEDFNDQLDLQQPGRLVPTWKATGVLTPKTPNLMSPLTVSWSYDDDDDNGMSASALAAANLSTARSSMSPESYVAALELSRSAVKPKQYSNFQKLKLQVALHKQHSQKQAVSIKKQDRQQDVQSYRELYNTFQEMQQELQQQQQETVNAAALAEAAVSPKTESLASGKKGRKAASPRKKNDKKKTPTAPQDPPGTPPMTRTNSFNLKNSNSWYFDFQAPELNLEQSIAGSTVNVTAADTVAAIAADTEFAAVARYDDDDDNSDDCSIVSRQSGLSLLSEATMDAQRRLYAEKRRERRRKKAAGASGAKSVTSRLSSLPTATPASTVTTGRRDYGPVRRLSKSMPQDSTAPLTEMEVSFVHSLEDASSPYKQQHDPDDASVVSDMGDDCSIASNNTGTNSNNDYRVPRRVRRSYNPDDAEVSRSPVKMSFSFDESAMAAVSVLRSNSNPGSPNNRGTGSGGRGVDATPDQEPPSRISMMGVAGASPLPHSQLMNRFNEAGVPSSPPTEMVSSSAKSPMAAAATTVAAASIITAPRTLDSSMDRKNISESPVPGTTLPIEDTVALDFLPRVQKEDATTVAAAALDFLPRLQKDATTIKSSSAAAALDFLPRVQTDVMTTATADGRMDAQIPTVAAVTPDKNSALPSIAKLKTMTLLADTGNASRDPLLEKDGSNLPPSTPTGASDSPAMVSPDWAHKIVESPIIATTKNMSSPVSPDSPQEDSFWESNTKSPESISTEQSDVQIEASPDKVELVTDEELHCSPVDAAITAMGSPDSISTEQSDVQIDASPDKVSLITDEELHSSPVDAAITAMSTEEFLRMAEDSKLGRYEYKSEFSSTESDSGASLLLAEEVEAQVKGVLTKYREYGDIYVAGAKSLSESDKHDDEPPRIISPEQASH